MSRVRVTMDNSGINWTGPRYAGAGVEIQVGYEWPGERTVRLMCSGTFEAATSQKQAIEAWARAVGVDLGTILDTPIDGTLLSCGFRTTAEIVRLGRARARRSGEYEAQLLRSYRRAGAECPRRARLEHIAATGEPDGFLLQEDGVDAFLEALTRPADEDGRTSS